MRNELVCKNPLHAMTDGSPLSHETGPSCMAESNELDMGTSLIVSLLEAWDTFHEHLPDGEYKGLGELRLILSLIKKRVNR